MAFRMDELSDANSTNTSKDDVRGSLCSDRHVFKNPTVYQGRSCEVLHDLLRISQRNTSSYPSCSASVASHVDYGNLIIYEDASWSTFGLLKVNSVTSSFETEQILTRP